MIEYNLRIGDAIAVSDVGVGVLTKKTKRYWYYFFQGKICRISKDKLWRHIDMENVIVKFGSTMKRRRKKKKGRVLDLHGEKHIDVEERVSRFLNFVELPCKIITGDSETMKNIVRKVLSKYGYIAHDDLTSVGSLIITESFGV